MKENKIHQDEIEWLVSIYNTSIDEELKNESYQKLIEYGITDNQIKDIFEKTKSEKDSLEAFNKARAKQAERNECEKYTPIEMIKIFLLAPYQLFKFFDSGLKELWDFNYKIKFRQRLILLILGTIFWVLFVVSIFKYSEYKRIKEIENIDIPAETNTWLQNKKTDRFTTYK